MLPCSLNSPLKPISESVIGNKSFNYLGFIKWILFNEEILWKSQCDELLRAACRCREKGCDFVFVWNVEYCGCIE